MLRVYAVLFYIFFIFTLYKLFYNLPQQYDSLEESCFCQDSSATVQH